MIVGATASQLEQFAGKGLTARLVAYPLLMLALPAICAWRRRARGTTAALPWGAFALVMSPFLIDVTGNTVNLYDTLAWWTTPTIWSTGFLLSAGIGLLVREARVQPPVVLGWLITGIGAVLAILWEIGEWFGFIRGGTELEAAYYDTLGDEALGILGAGLAGALIARLAGGRQSETSPSDAG